MGGIRHHLLDIIDTSDEYSAGDFYHAAREAAADILQVGGHCTFQSANSPTHSPERCITRHPTPQPLSPLKMELFNYFTKDQH